MITAIDVAWAAGFIEGEGTFASSGKGGVSLCVPQVQREPLERLQRLFGGNIRQPSETKTGKPLHRWGIHGKTAAAATMTVFSLLSPRRKEQALKLLDKWKAGKGSGCVHAQKTHCPKGHEYTAENTYRRTANPNWRTCRACTLGGLARRKLLAGAVTNT